MSNAALSTLAIFLLMPAFAQAQQQPEARAIIEKAVQAQGGLDKVTRAGAGYRKCKGHFSSDSWHFTGDTYSDEGEGDGNRLKIFLQGTDANAESRMLVMTGAKGWLAFNGVVSEFDDQMQTRMRRSAYADRVSGLVTLLRDKSFKLTLIDGTTVDNKPAVGVRVHGANGMPNIDLYFDKADGLLAKTTYLTFDDTMQEVRQDAYYSKYDEFDPAAEPLAILETAKLDTAAPALLKFLTERIPTAQERVKIQVLIVELGRTSYVARQKASATLEKFGAKAAAYLREAFKSDDPESVRRVEKLMEQIGQSEEPALCSAVARLLAVRRPAGAAAALLAYCPWACDDATSREVLSALTALAEIDSSSKVLLEAVLKDDDVKKRDVAAKVLGKDGGAFLKEPGRRVVLEGVRFARQARIFRSGKLNFEIETSDHQFFNRFDASVFARP
jgi:hypothetical protein